MFLVKDKIEEREKRIRGQKRGHRKGDRLLSNPIFLAFLFLVSLIPNQVLCMFPIPIVPYHTAIASIRSCATFPIHTLSSEYQHILSSFPAVILEDRLLTWSLSLYPFPHATTTSNPLG